MTDEQEHKLISMTKTDRDYLDLQKEYQEAEYDYLRIAANLTEEDKELLDHYISVCEDLEYRRTCLAFLLGVQEGVQTRCIQFENNE